MVTAEMRFSDGVWECEAVVALVLWRTAAAAVEEHLFLVSPTVWWTGGSWNYMIGWDRGFPRISVTRKLAQGVHICVTWPWVPLKHMQLVLNFDGWFMRSYMTFNLVWSHLLGSHIPKNNLFLNRVQNRAWKHIKLPFRKCCSYTKYYILLLFWLQLTIAIFATLSCNPNLWQYSLKKLYIHNSIIILYNYKM